MSGSERGGWFAYAPMGDNSHLTVDQLGLAEKVHEEHLDQTPAGTVQVLFASLEPGEAEVRIKNPPGHRIVEMIAAAIRELESARGDVSRDRLTTPRRSTFHANVRDAPVREPPVVMMSEGAFVGE